MAETLSQPLAEALVKVKLVYDKTEIKIQTNNAVNESAKSLKKQSADAAANYSKAYKHQMTALSREAKMLGMIGKEFNKVGNALILASGLGIGGALWKGLGTYLKTTDKGAVKLGEDLKDLNSAWQQFLARLGKSISQSKLFQIVLEKLTYFLNNANTDKILNSAKWMLIFGIVLKISGQIMLWSSWILKAQKAWMAMKFAEGAAIGVAGSVAGGIAGGVVKGAVAGSERNSNAQMAGGAAGLIGITAILEFLLNIKTLIKMLKGLVKEGSSLTESFKLIDLMAKDALAGQFGKAGKALEGVGKVIAAFRIVGTFLSKLIKVLIVFDVVAAALRGLGFNLTSGLELIVTGLGKVFKAINFFSDVITGATEAFWLIVNPFKSIKEKRKRILEIAGGGNKPEEFRFKNKGISSSSFEGLNKVAQDMVIAQEELSVLKKIEQNTRRWNDTSDNPTWVPGPSNVFKGTSGGYPINSYSVIL